MYFYITSSIGAYQFNAKKIYDKNTRKSFRYLQWVKVGFAKDTSSRFKEYHTINPKLIPAYRIELPKRICLNLEDAFKRYLHDKRIYGSECYQIKPKEAGFFATRCLSHLALVVLGYETFNVGSFNQSRLYYLHSIYFDKKIPLFELTNNRYTKKKGETKMNSYISYKKIKFMDKEIEKKYYNDEETYLYSPDREFPFNFNNKNILFNFMNDFDDYMEKVIEISNSSKDFLPYNPFKAIDRNTEDISTGIFGALSRYYYFFEKNNKIKKYFFKDIKFLDQQIESTKEITRQNAIYQLRERKIIAFDYMHDKRGPAGRKIKNDPYQLLRDRYFYNRTLTASKITRKKLLQP